MTLGESSADSKSKESTSNESTETTNKTSELQSFPLLPITSPTTIILCRSLPLLPTDIFICSYPKSGTTWTQHIVLSLLLANCNGVHLNHVSDFAPFFEIDVHWDLQQGILASSVIENHNRLGRRVFNTHLWWNMLPKQDVHEKPTEKFIYVVRKAFDVCVSFYHHLSNQVEGGYEETFDDFFSDWVEGKIAFGSYLDHLLSFAQAFSNDDGGLLLLSYEDMTNDLFGAVSSIVSFFDLNISDDQANELLESFSFQSMRENINKFQPRSVQWKNGFCFLRKGSTGDSDTVIMRKDDSLMNASSRRIMLRESHPFSITNLPY